MAWITPVTNWTSSDEINYGDFNRIENNIQELYAYLVSIQYAVPAPSSTDTSKTVSTIPWLSMINRIENNLDAIRVAFMTPADYLPKKTWSVSVGFDYTDANRLEKNTSSLLSWGMSVYQSYRYCGTFICGESGGLE